MGHGAAWGPWGHGHGHGPWEGRGPWAMGPMGGHMGPGLLLQYSLDSGSKVSQVLGPRAWLGPGWGLGGLGAWGLGLGLAGLGLA